MCYQQYVRVIHRSVHGKLRGDLKQMSLRIGMEKESDSNWCAKVSFGMRLLRDGWSAKQLYS